MADFDPDAYLAAKAGAQASPSPTPVDPLQLQQFDPDDYIKQKQSAQATELQEKFGTTPQQVLAGIEAVGRGATLGTSDYLAAKLTSPEAVQGRIQANPYTSFAGNVAGAGLLTAGTGGLGGLSTGIESAVGGLAGKAIGTAAEGALFGAGNAVSDHALGDPNLNAQKVLADVGMGAALGGGLGVLSKAIGALPGMIRASKAVPEAAEAGAPVVDLLGKKPTSLEEMQSAIENAKKYGNQENIAELPQKAEALEADSRLLAGRQFPLSQMQLDSLNSQDARNELKTYLELPGKNGQTLRDYQGAQKKELIGILDHTIDDEVSPGYHPTTDAIEAGERAAQSFTDQIEKTRSELKPAFQAIKTTPLEQTDHLPGVIDYLTNAQSSPYANPKISNMFNTAGDKIEIKPYSTSMGLDQATYRAVKQAVTALEEKPKNFENLFDIRKGLSQHVDVTKLGDASKEITAAKAAMMDYIQDSVQKVVPEQQVRDVFKKWAINEQNAQMIEKRFGAEIGSSNWRSLAKGGDESIIRKIFRDSDSVAAAKAILPQKDFENMLADHLSILRNDATDKGVFSSNKFFSNLRRNQYALGEAFAGNAPAYQKLKDSLMLLRIFPDDVPLNPSGTAKTFFQGMINAGIDPFKQVGNLIEHGKGKIGEVLKAHEINAKLAAQSDATKKLTSLQNMAQKVTSKINSGVKDIFSGGFPRGAALGGGAYLSDKEYDKITKQLHGYSSNPQMLMDDMAENTTHLYNAAPNITQSIHNSMNQAIQFLQSKMPQPTHQMPLSPKWEPTKAQKAKFSQYFQAIDNPLHALKQVKYGTLSNETMEALQVTHPSLLAEMRQKLTENMNIDKARDMPYTQRLSLAKFLGQPLDGNMTPMTIQSNQASFSAPKLSQQTSEAQASKSTLGGLKQLNFSNRVAPVTQREVQEV